MKHTRTLFATFLAALFTLFAFPAHTGDCLRLCDPGFMQFATAQDIRAEINKGAAIGARTANRLTPLHLAAISGNAETITALLDAGADSEARNRLAATPLHYAVGNGHADAVTALLAAGANAAARGGDGHTPLDLARLTGKLNGTDALQRLKAAAQ